MEKLENDPTQTKSTSDSPQTDQPKTDQPKSSQSGLDTDQTYSIQVAGETRNVTLDELRSLATKSAGADKKFEDAAAMRKEAERGLRITGLIESLSKDANEAEAKELAALLGVDPTDFVKWMEEDRVEKPPQKSTRGTVSKDDLAAGLKELGLDPAEVKGILDYSHQRHIAAAKAELRQKSDEAVDKDAVFGKMIVGENKDARREVIQEMVAEDVLEKIKEGVPFGADLLTASIQKVRAYLTKFGIPSKPERYPVMGLGPGQGLPSEVNSDEPIKRVSSAEDSSEDNVVARYMQKALRKLREGA